MDPIIPKAFGQLLKAHLSSTGMRPIAFADAVGVTKGYISRVVNHTRPAPKNLEKWADVLKLHGELREHFLLEGYLTQCPPWIVAWVRRKSQD
jgi:transcriptional regulator with XRE-family HTH domain